jgi:phospholipase/carboxylesterase
MVRAMTRTIGTIPFVRFARTTGDDEETAFQKPALSHSPWAKPSTPEIRSPIPGSRTPARPSGGETQLRRAPIAEGGAFAWFANRGIGRPVAESLAETMAWFRTWLDGVAPTGRAVMLVGFSGGAAFAGGLVLDDPGRYAGAAILYGTLPFDAGVPVEAGRLARLPVFVAQGDADQVIPAELLARTWDYLLGESAAPATAHRDAGGHRLTPAAASGLHDWLANRCTS